jgi:hypothetical protein
LASFTRWETSKGSAVSSETSRAPGKVKPCRQGGRNASADRKPRPGGEEPGSRLHGRERENPRGDKSPGEQRAPGSVTANRSNGLHAGNKALKATTARDHPSSEGRCRWENDRRAEAVERRYSSTGRGKLWRENPTGVSGMKEGHAMRGGESRQEVEKA